MNCLRLIDSLHALMGENLNCILKIVYISLSLTSFTSFILSKTTDTTCCWIITEFVARVTPSVTSGAGTAYPSGVPDLSPVFIGILVVRSLVFCIVFCRSLFVLLSFFNWPLCCLSIFDLQILITPLVSSNCSCDNHKEHLKSSSVYCSSIRLSFVFVFFMWPWFLFVLLLSLICLFISIFYCCYHFCVSSASPVYVLQMYKIDIYTALSLWAAPM